MKIHETLARDPRLHALANSGQARITSDTDERAVAELRAELETFVCDGQYGNAIERILKSYLNNLDRPKQDAAWVSGFFGSGKSHLQGSGREPKPRRDRPERRGAPPGGASPLSGRLRLRVPALRTGTERG